MYLARNIIDYYSDVSCSLGFACVMLLTLEEKETQVAVDLWGSNYETPGSET